MKNKANDILRDIDSVILNHYGKISVRKLAATLGISHLALIGRAIELGYQPRRRPFTQDEDDFIIKYYRDLPLEKIGNEIGRSPLLVKSRGIYLGLGRKPRIHEFNWGKADSEAVQFLIHHYRNDMNEEQIAVYFGISKKAVYQKAESLNLHKSVHQFSKVEDNFIRSHYRRTPNKAIGKKLNVSASTIYRRAQNMKLGYKTRYSIDDVKLIDEMRRLGYSNREIGLSLENQTRQLKVRCIAKKGARISKI